MLLAGILKYKISSLSHLQYGLAACSFRNSTEDMELMSFQLQIHLGIPISLDVCLNSSSLPPFLAHTLVTVLTFGCDPELRICFAEKQLFFSYTEFLEIHCGSHQLFWIWGWCLNHAYSQNVPFSPFPKWSSIALILSLLILDTPLHGRLHFI